MLRQGQDLNKRGRTWCCEQKTGNRQAGDKGRDERRGVARRRGQQAKSHRLDSSTAKTGQAGKEPAQWESAKMGGSTFAAQLGYNCSWLRNL